MIVLASAALATLAAVGPPEDHSGRPQAGVASFYGAKEAGRSTASGEPLKPGDLTAASRTLPIGTEAKVTNTETRKSVNVRALVLRRVHTLWHTHLIVGEDPVRRSERGCLHGQATCGMLEGRGRGRAVVFGPFSARFLRTGGGGGLGR